MSFASWYQKDDGTPFTWDEIYEILEHRGDLRSQLQYARGPGGPLRIPEYDKTRITDAPPGGTPDLSQLNDKFPHVAARVLKARTAFPRAQPEGTMIRMPDGTELDGAGIPLLEHLTDRSTKKVLITFKQPGVTALGYNEDIIQFLKKVYAATREDEASVRQQITSGLRVANSFVYTNGQLLGQLGRLEAVSQVKTRMDRLVDTRLKFNIFPTRNQKIEAVPNGVRKEDMKDFLKFLKQHYPLDPPEEDFNTYDLVNIIAAQYSLGQVTADGNISDRTNPPLALPTKKFKLTPTSDAGLLLMKNQNTVKRGEVKAASLKLATKLLTELQEVAFGNSSQPDYDRVREWVEARPYLYTAKGKRKAEIVEIAKYWTKIRTIWVFSDSITWPGNLLLGALGASKASMISNDQALTLYGFNPYRHTDIFIKKMARACLGTTDGYHLVVYSDNVYLGLVHDGDLVIVSLDGEKMEAQNRLSEAQAVGAHIINSAWPNGKAPVGWDAYFRVLLPIMVAKARTLIMGTEFQLGTMGSGLPTTFHCNTVKMLHFVYNYKRSRFSEKPPMVIKSIRPEDLTETFLEGYGRTPIDWTEIKTNPALNEKDTFDTPPPGEKWYIAFTPAAVEVMKFSTLSVTVERVTKIYSFLDQWAVHSSDALNQEMGFVFDDTEADSYDDTMSAEELQDELDLIVSDALEVYRTSTGIDTDPGIDRHFVEEFVLDHGLKREITTTTLANFILNTITERPSIEQRCVLTAIARRRMARFVSRRRGTNLRPTYFGLFQKPAQADLLGNSCLQLHKFGLNKTLAVLEHDRLMKSLFTNTQVGGYRNNDRATVRLARFSALAALYTAGGFTSPSLARIIKQEALHIYVSLRGLREIDRADVDLALRQALSGGEAVEGEEIPGFDELVDMVEKFQFPSLDDVLKIHGVKPKWVNIISTLVGNYETAPTMQVTMKEVAEAPLPPPINMSRIRLTKQLLPDLSRVKKTDKDEFGEPYVSQRAPDGPFTDRDLEEAILESLGERFTGWTVYGKFRLPVARDLGRASSLWHATMSYWARVVSKSSNKPFNQIRKKMVEMASGEDRMIEVWEAERDESEDDPEDTGELLEEYT